MTAGLLNKAQRGDLALVLPVGRVRDGHDIVQKDPHHDVQHCLEVIFMTFLRVKSANKVLRDCKAQHLTIPRRTQDGQILWKPPTIAAILAVLKNPAYAGAFVYGKTKT